MEVNWFQILLIDVQKVVLNVLIKNENPNICGTGGQRVKHVQNKLGNIMKFQTTEPYITMNVFFKSMISVILFDLYYNVNTFDWWKAHPAIQ